MDAASLSIGEQLGEGDSSRVHEVTDGNMVYACKLFLTKEVFEAEKAAYERIQRVDALRGRVPKLYSVPVPFVILMENVEGTSLEEAVIPPSERAEIEKQLAETLDLLHREAGVYHGDVYARNIIIKDGRAKLLDFSLSTLQDDVPKEQHEQYAQEDRRALRAIFFEMGREAAYREALVVIDRMRDSCPHHDINEEKLAELLPRIGSSYKELLNAILTVLPAPTPSIALWVAKRLSWGHRYNEAVGILRSCLARYEMPESNTSISNEILLELRECAARFAGRAGRLYSNGEQPSAEELLEDAVAFYVRSAPKLGQRSGADEKVLKLRLELVEILQGRCQSTAALRVCVRAMEEAGVCEKKVQEEKTRDFVKKTRWLLRKVKDRELWDRAAKLIGYDDNTFEQCRAEDLD